MVLFHLLRFFLSLIFVLSPLFAALYFLTGPLTVAVVFGVFLGLFLAVMTYSERMILRRLQVSDEKREGLEKTLRQLFHEIGKNPSRDFLSDVLVYPNPAPNVLVLRSIGSRGTLLLSQGILATSTEIEIRALLRKLLNRVEHPDLPVTTACALLSSWVLSLAPEQWRALAYQRRDRSGKEHTPFSGVLFLVLLPLVRFFQRCGNPRRALDPSPTAKQALSKNGQIWSPLEHPGLRDLYLPGSSF